MSLRPLVETDLMIILDWRNSPTVRRYMYNNQVISETEHRGWFERMKQDPRSLWYIHENQNGEPDGVVYFTQFAPKAGRTFWGFYMAPEARKGAGTSLGIDGLDEAFGALSLHKLNSEVLVTNQRSVNFHEKLGFRREGVFREFHFDGKRHVDVVRFGILGSEWYKEKLRLIASLSRVPAGE